MNTFRKLLFFMFLVMTVSACSTTMITTTQKSPDGAEITREEYKTVIDPNTEKLSDILTTIWKVFTDSKSTKALKH